MCYEQYKFDKNGKVPVQILMLSSQKGTAKDCHTVSIYTHVKYKGPEGTEKATDWLVHQTNGCSTH
jgi:hypothetical protein